MVQQGRLEWLLSWAAAGHQRGVSNMAASLHWTRHWRRGERARPAGQCQLRADCSRVPARPARHTEGRPPRPRCKVAPHITLHTAPHHRPLLDHRHSQQFAGKHNINKAEIFHILPDFVHILHLFRISTTVTNNQM